MFSVEVRNRQVGTTQTDDTPPDVVLELLYEELTVAQLVTYTVEEQIRDLILIRRLDAEQACRILQQQYLSQSDIEKQAITGEVKLPRPQVTRHYKIDTKKEVKRALQAFESGAYFVFVDGHQAERLDEVLQLKPNSKINFLRVTPLVGG